LARDALALSGVNAFYGDSHALHDVSFTLREGSVLALLGRNGAGKTTCIHCVSGLLARRTGSIELFGEPIDELPPEAIARRGIGLVPQGRRVFPSLTVRENLTVAARGRGPWNLPAIYGAFPRLREREGQAAGSLSGGEQQMLAIGRALMTNPRVLLLDEPSEGLAPQVVAEVARVLARLRESGLSIVLVEQNTKLALGVADSVVALNTGRVAFAGAADTVRGDASFLAQHLGVH
jgi:branched-chain amino acid transport system ATP-binding protein